MPIVVYILVFFVAHHSQSSVHVVCPPQSSYYYTPKLYPLGHGYRILVVLLPNMLFSSLITNYRSLLTAQKITVPSHRLRARTSRG